MLQRRPVQLQLKLLPVQRHVRKQRLLHSSVVLPVWLHHRRRWQLQHQLLHHDRRHGQLAGDLPWFARFEFISQLISAAVNCTTSSATDCSVCTACTASSHYCSASRVCVTPSRSTITSTTFSLPKQSPTAVCTALATAPNALSAMRATQPARPMASATRTVRGSVLPAFLTLTQIRFVPRAARPAPVSARPAMLAQRCAPTACATRTVC